VFIFPALTWIIPWLRGDQFIKVC
jgi:hypothetical protein